MEAARELSNHDVYGFKCSIAYAHGSPKRSMSGMATRVALGRCRCWYGATRVHRFRSAHRCSHSKHTTSRSARTWVATTTVSTNRWRFCNRVIWL